MPDGGAQSSLRASRSSEPTLRAEVTSSEPWELHRENQALKDLIERLHMELEEAVKREQRWKTKAAKLKAMSKSVTRLVILLGICAGDDIELAQRLAFKACKLRLWDARDGAKSWASSVLDNGFSVLAQPIYEAFVSSCKEMLDDGRVATGEFGAMMEVDLCNDGPVTVELTGHGNHGVARTAGRVGVTAQRWRATRIFAGGTGGRARFATPVSQAPEVYPSQVFQGWMPVDDRGYCFPEWAHHEGDLALERPQSAPNGRQIDVGKKRLTN
eukprot:symbB.v1.2.026667.t2/scaffold2686.1/size73053/7